MIVNVEPNKRQMAGIQKKLDRFQKDLPRKQLKRALNETAKQACRIVITETKQEYQAKGGMGAIKKNVAIKNAAVGKLSAVILSKGSMKDIGEFKVSPFRVANGFKRPKQIKGKVKRSGRLKPLKDGRAKAFVAKFRSGHMAAVVRVPGKRMRGNPKKEALRKLMSPATPIMMGNKQVLEKAEPKIAEVLQKALEEHINTISIER